MDRPNYRELGEGPAFYVGREHGGPPAGRNCENCIHVRDAGKVTLCILPLMLKTPGLPKVMALDTVFHKTVRMVVVDPKGCCSYWRDVP